MKVLMIMLIIVKSGTDTTKVFVDDNEEWDNTGIFSDTNDDPGVYRHFSDSNITVQYWQDDAQWKITDSDGDIVYTNNVWLGEGNVPETGWEYWYDYVNFETFDSYYPGLERVRVYTYNTSENADIDKVVVDSVKYYLEEEWYHGYPVYSDGNGTYLYVGRYEYGNVTRNQKYYWTRGPKVADYEAVTPGPTVTTAYWLYPDLVPSSTTFSFNHNLNTCMHRVYKFINKT